MNYKYYVLIAMFLALVFSGFLPSNTKATVGGPTFIYDFKYNSQDESVYYINVSASGRGCPPELKKLSLTSGGPQVVYSCTDGEKLISKGGSVYSAINNITSSFKNLVLIDLKKNNISVDVNFVDYKKFDPDINEIESANFIASVYQNNKKVAEFPVTGCNLEQPFVFAGYAIPGFDKKIVLLLSTKGDCWEGGYIHESLHVVGGLENLNKTGLNYYKDASALTPNEGTLVVFEADKIKANTPEVPSKNDDNNLSNSQMMYLYLIGFFVAVTSLIIGIVIGKLFVKNNNI